MRTRQSSDLAKILKFLFTGWAVGVLFSVLLPGMVALFLTVAIFMVVALICEGSYNQLAVFQGGAFELGYLLGIATALAVFFQ